MPLLMKGAVTNFLTSICAIFDDRNRKRENDLFKAHYWHSI